MATVCTTSRETPGKNGVLPSKSENSNNVLFVLILSADAPKARQPAHREEAVEVWVMQEPAIKRLQHSGTSKGCGDLVLPRSCNLHLRYDQLCGIGGEGRQGAIRETEKRRGWAGSGKNTVKHQ